MRGFPLLVLWALQVAFVGCSGTDRCNSSDACERQDDVPLLQLKTHVEGCADELWKAAVRTIQHMDQTSPSDLAPRGSPEFMAIFVVLDESLRWGESILMQAFEKGCNPKTSPLSKTECQEVQLAHERTYSQPLVFRVRQPWNDWKTNRVELFQPAKGAKQLTAFVLGIPFFWDFFPPQFWVFFPRFCFGGRNKFPN